MRSLAALPKANLHLHLTGAMRPGTLAELAARHGLPIPAPLPADVQHGWETFQERYDAARCAVRTREDVMRVVREAIADNAADGAGWSRRCWPASTPGSPRILRPADRVDKGANDTAYCSGGSVTDQLDQALLDGVRAARRAFARELAPLREPLYKYCRRLTGDVWEAEDLLQETFVRAFSRAADSHQPIERPLAWLVRIATNAYIDSRRRPAPLPVAAPDAPGPDGTDPAEVRDALAEVTTLLAPQERAALVLKDVFDLPLAEIAAMIGTTVGAVKAALHRGRSKLDDPDRYAPRRRPDRAVVDALAEAFTAYDLDRLTALFLADGVSDVIGAVHEVGRDRIRAGSLHHTLLLETEVRYRGEVREFNGEPIVVLWGTFEDGQPDAVRDILRLETADGGIARLRWYYFCPEVLTEVGAGLGVPVRTA